ncbi:glycosyltransferase family 4 protein [Aquisphaera insulae]|uniref:glycosyltransferase family 4 protein n=1 Tax=Aquisphaera insulae TaxID=2712864 RepID=UPI0013EBCFE7|nr:glycosyltransferase [Aquisphaera insulae]
MVQNPAGSAEGSMTRRQPSVVFVQFGDYAGAVHRFASGLGETYYAQRYSVDLVEKLPATCGPTTVITVAKPAADEVLPSGVRCIGLPEIPWNARTSGNVLRRLKEISPTSVIVRYPCLPIIRWCLREGVRVLPFLADSFRRLPLSRRIHLWRLARVLNQPGIDFVANHQLDASRDLVRVGVSAKKILPWDWPRFQSPADFPPKLAPREPGKLSVAYAGAVVEEKGVGDLIRAIAILRRGGNDASAALMGTGKLDEFQALARSLGVADHVRFLGQVTHDDVIATMRECDVVTVPSHHAYGEGLPMAIIDGFISRSPLVISDHPMFVARLRGDRAVSIFPQKDPAALAECLKTLADDQDRYRSQSAASEATWGRLGVPLVAGDLWARWLSGTPEDLGWLSQYSLATYPYS